MNQRLNAERISEIFRNCLFKNEEVADKAVPPDGAVLVEGVVGNYGFHPTRLAEAEPAVREALAELPDQFRKNGGGGWTFLNACMTRDGEQWGEHDHMEQLFCLAIGLGLAQWTLPREVWGVLPCGMPYVTVLV